jgi:hypothetical protein
MEDEMGDRIPLTGRFVRVEEAKLREKANRTHDPRHVFYREMLENDTYEDYENATCGVEVHPITYRSRPVSGHREMIYVRNRRRWIEDG